MTTFRSGFVAVVGRPNVGKSTLVNAMVGAKVTITSPRPNTTRSQVRGVLDRPDAQVVFVDTPGLHRPRTALGQRMNESATSSLDDVDVVVAMVEATGAVGPGDRMVLGASARRVRSLVRAAPAEQSGPGRDAAGIGEPTLLVVVNKIDRADGDGILTHLAEVAEVIDAIVEEGGGPVPVEYFPVSAATGEGVPALVEAVVDASPRRTPVLPRGDGHRRGRGLVGGGPGARGAPPPRRRRTAAQHRLPRHRVGVAADPLRDPGRTGLTEGHRHRQGGSILKEVGIAVRKQLPPGAYLELFVRVEKHWQQRDDALDRLGL